MGGAMDYLVAAAQMDLGGCLIVEDFRSRSPEPRTSQPPNSARLIDSASTTGASNLYPAAASKNWRAWSAALTGSLAAHIATWRGRLHGLALT
jgi:hypothetical protein